MKIQTNSEGRSGCEDHNQGLRVRSSVRAGKITFNAQRFARSRPGRPLGRTRGQDQHQPQLDRAARPHHDPRRQDRLQQERVAAPRFGDPRPVHRTGGSGDLQPQPGPRARIRPAHRDPRRQDLAEPQRVAWRPDRRPELAARGKDREEPQHATRRASRAGSGSGAACRPAGSWRITTRALRVRSDLAAGKLSANHNNMLVRKPTGLHVQSGVLAGRITVNHSATLRRAVA